MLGEQFSGCLERAQAGDEDSFARLFRDLAPLVFRYVRVMASTAAEDVAAETWLEVVRGLRQFSGDEDGFRAWVLTLPAIATLTGFVPWPVGRLRFTARRPSSS